MFEFSETELSCWFICLEKCFRGFVNLVQLEDVTDCLSSVLVCIIVLFFMAGSSRNIKKNINVLLIKNTQKELNNIT